MAKTDYKSSGVDIDAGNEAVNRIGPLVKTTFGPEVLTGLGSFGSMVELGPTLKNYTNPVLIQSIDGVGTKVSVAKMAGKYYNLGIDVVSATTNDILVHGASPVTFLDYIANEKLDPAVVEEIVSGMVENCRENGIALVGGETAEMPSTYLAGEHDIVGCVTGLVDKDKIINGADISVGDAVIALPSSGLHTNGFSLARKVFFEVAKMTTETYVDELGETVGDALLRPHLNYRKPIDAWIAGGVKIKGLSHITGGGFLENIPRILPEGTSVEVEKGTWPGLPVFSVIADAGEVEEMEMFRTFNMGIGLVAVVPEAEAEKALETIRSIGGSAYRIGSVIEGDRKVLLK
ncbi:phosphoribosylformylglycinamidine cyclo-ligase [Puniceicoccus vermicola]|uniref:Phosphoribosylformylglycinamidine cyclo-ligase n=1 Tax=Puniceicoccus vermicola TaxID=388746 RepID=A0A7X1AYS5_9BACT|nr:phosphoribosylformylglycinamidine cyclo-ligase [Puniceicoccus vermicola]MBC2602457.1 phosphoribosylformylglycinamidine cyclo-ligase [Puniceicoccus vermicola]